MTSIIFAPQMGAMASTEEYRSLPELVEQLQKEIAQMQSGDIDMSTMSAMVDDAREMYERLLIIRHKLYEEVANGDSDEQEEEVIEEEKEEETAEPIAFSIPFES